MSAATDARAPAKVAGPLRRALARLARQPSAWISGGFILGLALVSVLTPLLVSNASMFAASDAVLLPPSAEYWFGTDDLGRDLFVQVMYGAQVSLTVGVCSAAVATLLGVVIGSISGYGGPRLDAGIMRVTEIFQVMPTFVLAALIVALLGPGEGRVIGVIAGLAWPQSARLIRGEVLRLKHQGFVEAARCLGIAEWRILSQEVVPNALAPVLALSTLTAAFAILLEAALGFFGLTSSDTISWGLTLSAGQRLLYQAWWLSVFPGLAIFLTALTFNMLGDCVREAFNPRGQAV